MVVAAPSNAAAVESIEGVLVALAADGCRRSLSAAAAVDSRVGADDVDDMREWLAASLRRQLD